jgi:hypothetical protein
MAAEYVDLGALPDRKFYLIDTFSGIPRRFREGRAALFDGVYDDCYDEVVRTFAPYPNARIIRGDIPDVLDQVRPSRVAFLSIDLNVAEPSVAALAHFWPLLTPGAAVVLDDYNFQFFADQRPALDAVAGQLGARILALPTGQGLIVKP